MSQPQSFDQLSRECCDELRARHPRGGQGEAAVSRFDWAEWLRYLPIAGVVCSLGGTVIGTLIARHVFWNPQKAQLAKPQADLEKALQEKKTSRAPEPSPEMLEGIAELMSLMEKLLTELRGKVTPDELNSAQDACFAKAADLGARDHEADEVAHMITDKF